VHHNLIISNFLINGILLLLNNVFSNKEKFLLHFFHVHFLLYKVFLYILVLLLYIKQLYPILFQISLNIILNSSFNIIYFKDNFLFFFFYNQNLSFWLIQPVNGINLY
ncbi:hypothetical protein H311_00073, partial [Anncaliia algerae PRA109]